MKLQSFDFPKITARARCLNVVDGDTLDLEVDLGFKLKFTSRFRLLGIDTPELRSKDAQERAKAQLARDALKELVFSETYCQWPLLVTIDKDPDNFGRYLASIMIMESEDRMQGVASILLERGLAVPYEK